MNMELLLQYITYALMAVGVAAFLVSCVTQVIKDLPWLTLVPTSVVALIVSMILCPVAVIVACQYYKIVIEWYYIFASFVAAFIVYLVSTGGWERLKDIWDRTKYKKEKLQGSRQLPFCAGATAERRLYERNRRIIISGKT